MKRSVPEGSRILTAWAENCAGPGWCNTPIWVHYKFPFDEKIREECIQPEERSPKLEALAQVSAIISAEMTREVEKLLVKKGNR